MQSRGDLEEVLGRWGEQLLRPGLRRHGRPGRDPIVFRPSGTAVRAGLRTILQRAPEVMVKVTGGGRGMGAIKAHFSYISRRGDLALENQMGLQIQGKEDLALLADEWRYGGGLIPDVSHRREAFHLMLSMPPDTDAQAVLAAAREFAGREFADHKYALVLHDPARDPDSHRPHVHLIVRAQGASGQRLNPRKADLARWRQAFADRLMERGVAASATRRQTRGILRSPKKLHEYHVSDQKQRGSTSPQSERARQTEDQVLVAWQHVANALLQSPARDDRALGQEALDFVASMPAVLQRSRSMPAGINPPGREFLRHPEVRGEGAVQKTPDRGSRER